MAVIWDDPDRYVQVRDVRQAMPGLAYTTVMTVMSRLHDKGILKRRKDRRAWAYRPTLTREAYVAAAMADALSGAGDRTAALLHFVADLVPGEAAALRRLLEISDGPEDS